MELRDLESREVDRLTAATMMDKEVSTVCSRCAVGMG